MAKSKKKTDKKKKPPAKPKAPPKPTYKVTVGITKDKKYTFDHHPTESLADVIKRVESTIKNKQGYGLREVMISINKKADPIK